MKNKILVALSAVVCAAGCKKEISHHSNLPKTVTIVVSTVAGDKTKGSANGAGVSASFNWPSSVAVDVAGNLYVADTFNSLVRKISRSGLVTTLAGSGTDGYADGNGVNASFSGPWGVAADPAGNVYISDHRNYLIRKITPAGAVSTYAGNGTPDGPSTGTGTAVSFYSPAGICTDLGGNVYVAGFGDSRVFKISPGAVVSIIAGGGRPGFANGIGVSASLYIPAGVACDAAGNLYVADSYNNAIRKISSSGLVTTLAGSGTKGNANGMGTSASFFNPQDVAVDAAGNVYVADEGNNLIRKISPEGLVSTLAGTSAAGSVDGPGDSASFYGPSGLAIDAEGNLYVADTYNNLIRKITIQQKKQP